MKCFDHPDLDATGTCQDCGKGLCQACTGRFSDVVCEGCFLAHNKRVARRMYAGLAGTAALFGASLYLLSTLRTTHGGHLGVGPAVLPSVLLAFAFWGWRFLSAHAPRLGAGSGFVWAIYLVVKSFASLLLGVVVGPFQIVRQLREIYVARKARRQIARGEG